MTSPTGLNYRTLPIHSVVKTLPEAAQVLLSTLYWHRNKDTGQLNPRHSTLGRELGWSYWKVQTYIRVLREACIVRAVKRRRGNDYEIRPQEEWRRPERAAWAPACKPRQDSHIGGSTYVETHRQDDSILYERETLISEQEEVPPPKYSRESGGGGAPLEQSSRTPQRQTPPASRPAPEQPCLEEQTSDPATVAQAIALVEELAPSHPQAGNVSRAVPEVAKLLAAAEDRPKLVAQIRSSHLQWRSMWCVYRPGRFIPQLWRWFKDRDWLYPPDAEQIRLNTRKLTDEEEREASVQRTLRRVAQMREEEARKAHVA